MVELFQSSKANISEHIKNVFDEGELSPEATVRDFRTVRIEGARSVARTVQQYNLDLILSLGYRVKSKVATQFRVWANGVLKRYIMEGVATNEARLREIGTMVQLLERSSDDTVAGIAEVLRKYTPGLALLDEYDRGAIPPATSAATRSEASSVTSNKRSSAKTCTKACRRRPRICSTS